MPILFLLGVPGQSPRTPDQTNKVPRSGAMKLARGMEARRAETRNPARRDLKGLGLRQPGPAKPDAHKEKGLVLPRIGNNDWQVMRIIEPMHI